MSYVDCLSHLLFTSLVFHQLMVFPHLNVWFCLCCFVVVVVLFCLFCCCCFFFFGGALSVWISFSRVVCWLSFSHCSVSHSGFLVVFAPFSVWLFLKLSCMAAIMDYGFCECMCVCLCVCVCVCVCVCCVCACARV